MATEYYDPDPSVRDALNAVLEEYFPSLHAMEDPLRIDIRMAVGENENEPALKHRGHIAAATIETIKPKEKSKSKFDLRLTIDRCLWEQDSDETNTAKLHHELTHVDFKRDKNGEIKIDAYGRPAIKLRPDDWCLTGFRETVRIFGEASVERRSLRNVETMLCQQDFGFMGASQSAVVERVAELDRAAEAGEEPSDTTITFSHGGKSVTLTEDQFKTVTKSASSPRRDRAAMSAPAASAN